MAIANIVVGIDHSDRSDKALKRANQIALFHDAKLIVEYALDVGAAQRLRGLIERVALEEARERADAVLGKDGASYEVLATAGRPFEVLRDIAQEKDADLVVLGVHRRDPGMFRLSGSTARRLINVAPAPVLVVSDEPNEGYKNVLVGYDDSKSAREALRYVRALAPNAKITIVTACMIPFAARRAEAELLTQFEAETRAMTKEALRESGDHDLELIVRVGEALGVILEVQRERKFDLLTLGTSMPALYRHVFGGGMVDEIAADPPCDLLVVKT
jgi:nucleotide-binding universal stress UspA family protein